MRIHEVAPLKQVQEEHAKDPEEAARNLWGWVSPEAVARACLASVEGDKFQGHESTFLVFPSVIECYSPGSNVSFFGCLFNFSLQHRRTYHYSEHSK